MRKGRNVIGQSVLSYADGARIDTVKDLVLSESNELIVALLVDEGGLLSSSRVIPIENVRTFGRDAVVVESKDSVISASADAEVKAILNRKGTLLGTKVVSSTGQALGSISDMYFEETSGRIDGFEVSGGALGDIARGPSFLSVGEIERMGPDALFVSPQTAEDLQGQVGGVQGAIQTAGAKVGDATTRAREQLEPNGTGGANRDHLIETLVGRRVGSDVTDDNGHIVVPNGEPVGPEHVDWALENDRAGVLTNAVGAGGSGQGRATAALDHAGDNIAGVWDRFVTRLGEIRDDQGRQADAAQRAQRLTIIQDAIGRPVTKVILDKSDNVILDFGDVVTHRAIQLAFEAGMLDTLLGSIYRVDAATVQVDLRSRQPAAATIERSHGGATVVEDLERQVSETERERTERRERERQEAEQARQQAESDRQQRERERREAAEQEQQLEAKRLQAVEMARTGSATGSNGDQTSANRPPIIATSSPSREESPVEHR